MAEAHQLPSYAVVKANLSAADGAAGYSMAQKANDKKATPEEVAALIDYHENGVAPCRKVSVDGLNQVHPALAAVVIKGYVGYDSAYLKLVKREMSWGQFSQEIAEIDAAQRVEWEQVAQSIKGQLEQANQAELQRRQAAAAALQQSIYQQQVLAQNQQMINAANRPVQTNCMRNGMYVNCTSY